MVGNNQGREISPTPCDQLRGLTRPRLTLLADQSGVALVVVIVVMLVASFLASQLTLSVRAEQHVTINQLERSQAAFLAEAGINNALFRLLDKPLLVEDEEEEKMLHGHLYEGNLESGTFSYRTINESGKMNINTVSPRLLELFLEHFGLEPVEIETVRDSMSDWQDSDNLHRLNGAEQNFYEELEEPYTPRNGRMEDPSEFFLVRGTELLKDKFQAEDVFTIYNTTKKINFNSLSPTMLDFVMAGDEDRKEAYREAQGVYTTLNQAMARQLMGDEQFDQLKSFLSFTADKNIYLTINATGKTNQGKTGITASALIRLLANGYQIMSWKEGYA